jgi:subtilase family serine protease
LTPTCKTSKSGTKCKITGELVIQNIGTQNASSSVVKFYLSDDEVYDENDTFLKQATIGKMKAKATKTTKLTYTLATSVLGKYIIAVIDADHTVNEQYETNNNIAFGPIK